MIRLKLPDDTYFDLPPDLYWEDEFQWDPIAQTVKQLLPDADGESALLIQETKKKAGRPITLASGANRAWMKRTAVEALRALAATRPALTLLMDGRSNLSVRFRFDGGSAIAATPVGGPYPEPPTGNDWHEIKIKLIEV
jgi:hypothetical protein